MAIVTGAARGVGAATTRRLRADGYLVVGVDLDAPTDEDGIEAFVRGDVADPQTGVRAVAAAADLGPLNVLVNSAGIVIDRAFTAQDDPEWQAVLSAVVDGTRLMVRAVVASMQADARRELARGPGLSPRPRRIVNTVPSAFETGTPGASATAAAGGAVVGLTTTLARELGGWGIRVNAVLLGYISTRLTDPLSPPDGVIGLPEPVRQMAAATTALGRFGDPAEVAAVHAFLAGPDADYVTGAVVPVTGGLLGT